MNYAPDSSWVLDPRESFSQVFDKAGFPKGIGNQVSVEFNLIYRWHSTVSARDEKWSQDFFQKLFPGQDVAKLSLRDFLTGLSKWKEDIASQKPESRTFADLKRNSSGAFDTKALAKLIAESTQDVAGKCTLSFPPIPASSQHPLTQIPQAPSALAKCLWYSSSSKSSASVRRAAGTSAR
jgi:hypothetical protein